MASPPTASYLGNILYASSASLFAGLSTVFYNNQTPKEEILDSISVVVGLALLTFYDKKTKINIRDHEVRRDHYYQNLPILQGGKRSVLGGSSKELHNLSAPLFYACLWIRPSCLLRAEKEKSKNKGDYDIIFQLAKEGLEQLIAYAYERDYQVQQYLHCCHLRILKCALTGDPLNRDEFLIPDWESNPVATQLKRFWLEEDRGKTLKNIADLFEKAVEKKKDGGNISGFVQMIKEELVSVHEFLKRKLKSMTTGKDEETQPGVVKGQNGMFSSLYSHFVNE